MAVLALAGPAQADPISLIAGGAALWASLGLVGQIAVFAAVAVAGFGLAYLLGAGGQRQADAGAEQPGVQIAERDGLLEARRVYGRFTVAGGVFFQKTVADSGAAGPNIYVLGLALSQGECDALESVIINGVECELDSSGLPITSPWVDAGTTYLKASFRSGSDSQAIDPIIAARFPDEVAEFRQRGICTVVLEMNFGTDVDHHTALWGAGGIPQLAFKIRGLHVYDPTDASQDIDDPTTWTWSQNATLIEADWLRSDMGFGIAAADIDWASALAESETTDDRWVALLAGGAERSGTINGFASSAESNVEVLQAMGQQNRATFGKAFGQYFIRAERMAEPVATLHQGLLVGDLSYQNEPDSRAALNRIEAQFFPASRFNQAAETVYEDTALQAADGQELAQRVTFRYCDSPPTAQRLGHALVEENRAGRTLSGVFDIAALVAPGKANGLLEPGDVVWAEFDAPYDAINGLYRVGTFEISADFRVSIPLTGTSVAVIGGWSPALETAFDEEAA